jgi:hypothetical protein
MMRQGVRVDRSRETPVTAVAEPANRASPLKALGHVAGASTILRWSSWTRATSAWAPPGRCLQNGEGNHLLAFQVAAALGEHLVFDVDDRDARFEQTHQEARGIELTRPTSGLASRLPTSRTPLI